MLLGWATWATLSSVLMKDPEDKLRRKKIQMLKICFKCQAVNKAVFFLPHLLERWQIGNRRFSSDSSDKMAQWNALL